MVSGGGGGFQRAPTSGLPMTTSGSRLPIAAQVGAQASPYADLAQGVEQYQDLGGDAIRRAPTDSNTLPPATGPTGGNPVGTPETQAAQPTWQPNAQEGQGERDANHFAAATNFRDQQSGVQGFRDLYHRDPTASDAAEVERLRKMNAAPDDNPLYRGFEEAVRAGVLPNTQEGMGQWLAANSQRGDDPNAATFRKYMEQGGDTSFQRSDALKAKSAADAARIAITGREKTPDEQRQEQIDGMLQGIARINGIAGTELPTSNVKMGNLEITPEEYAAAMRRIGAKTRQPGEVAGFTTPTGQPWTGTNSPAPEPASPAPGGPAVEAGAPGDGYGTGNGGAAGAGGPGAGGAAGPAPSDGDFQQKIDDILNGYGAGPTSSSVAPTAATEPGRPSGELPPVVGGAAPATPTDAAGGQLTAPVTAVAAQPVTAASAPAAQTGSATPTPAATTAQEPTSRADWLKTFEQGQKALDSYYERVREERYRKLSENMAARNLIGSSVEQDYRKQIDDDIAAEKEQKAYEMQRDLMGAEYQGRQLGLQETQLSQQDRQFTQSLTEQVTGRLQQESQFARGLSSQESQNAIQNGIAQEAQRLQALGMDRDEAFRKASFAIDTTLRAEALKLQKTGMAQDESYRYAALSQDANFRNMAMDLQRQGMAQDEAYRKAAQQIQQEQWEKSFGETQRQWNERIALDYPDTGNTGGAEQAMPAQPTLNSSQAAAGLHWQFDSDQNKWRLQDANGGWFN